MTQPQLLLAIIGVGLVLLGGWVLLNARVLLLAPALVLVTIGAGLVVLASFHDRAMSVKAGGIEVIVEKTSKK